MRNITQAVLLSLLVLTSGAHADEEEEEEEAVELIFSADERQELGIEIARVGKRTLYPEVTAPGEVMLNVYATSQIASRIDAQVIARHARMGNTVETGQPLVTLSSVDMADAVGDLLVNDREWRRVKNLGRDVVSESRYIEAEVARQRAYAKALAYGMPRQELERLLEKADVSEATGEYTLHSQQSGVVIRDGFVLGEVVDAGQLLMELSDLTALWVEARVDPELAAAIAVGDVVRVTADDETWISGTVVQRAPHLDEATRTLDVRIEVQETRSLFPGQFVNIAVRTGQGLPSLAVPDTAIMLIQGTPMVFKLEGNEFEPQPIETGLKADGFTAITNGVDEEDTIAVAGVFQLKSLLLKSQIGDTD
ncbi:MAG: efflux RND transporter periplasmic adaptor subunit [Pseudomonadales bacterium]